jgi:hypothetical protein
MLAGRTRDLLRFRRGELPAGEELAGKRVAVALDGGRVRVRTVIKKVRVGGKIERQPFRVEWREPKLVIVFETDEKGRMTKGCRPVIDGTLRGPDALIELTAFHLHRLGAAQANVVTFTADGAPWIWGAAGLGDGQVLAHLKRLGLDRRTLVVFTSDNGPWYGGSTGGLRGMKSTTWEGGFRVPCIVRWPGRLSAGTVCRELAVTMDLFATALAAAGVPPPRDRVIDGTDLFPLFSGKEHAAHAVVFGHQGPHLAMVRDGRWKLHLLPARNGRQSTQGQRWLDPRGPDGVTILAPYEQSQPIEFPGVRTGDETRAMSLFDLESDPGEQHVVSAQHGDIVARLKAR